MSNQLLARAYFRMGDESVALEHSRRAVAMLDEVDILGIDEILVTHAKVVEEVEGSGEEWRRTVDRAIDVFESRRDGIDAERDREAYVRRRVSRAIDELARRIDEVGTPSGA